MQLHLLNEPSAFKNWVGPKINYSPTPLTDQEVWIVPHGLLFEEHIKNQAISVKKEKGIPFFFETPSNQWFDVFAAGFYLLSRYEEYLPFEADTHGRFPAAESLAQQQGFLEIPVVHLWENALKGRLKHSFPGLSFPQRSYTFLPTFDIDQAWAYLHKPTFRQLLGAARDIRHGRFSELSARLQSLTSRQPDPFFTFNRIEQWHEQPVPAPTFFFLLGDYGPFDKNTDPRHPAFRSLLKNLSKKYHLGIHPSYQSNSAAAAILREKKRLENTTETKITSSRQHFLKVHLPTTYRALLDAGITTDYSLGYADAVGFRAGIAVPFFWYDLEAAQQTHLQLVPFQVMDVTLNQYLQLNQEQAMKKTEALIQAIRSVNGTFCTLWHNSSLSGWHNWAGWEEFYPWLIQKAVP